MKVNLKVKEAGMETKRNVINVSEETHKLFKRFCVRTGWKMNMAAERAVLEWLDRHDPEFNKDSKNNKKGE